MTLQTTLRKHVLFWNIAITVGFIRITKLDFEIAVDHQFVVKFHGKSNGDSLDALKRCFDPEMAHKGLIGAKIKNLQYELGELGHHTVVKFNGKSNGDSRDALKR